MSGVGEFMITNGSAMLIIIALLLPLGCVHPIHTRERSVAQVSNVRARVNRSPQQVIVYRKNVEPYLMTLDIPNQFNIFSADSVEPLKQLHDFFLRRKTTLGVNADNDDFQLILRNVRDMGDQRKVITWDQVQERRVGNLTYRTPVSGGSLVVILKGNRLDSVNTSLFSIRSQSFAFNRPGFDLSSLSDNEIQTLSDQIKNSNNKELVENYFNQVIRQAGLGINFDIEGFLKMSISEQRDALEQLFGELNRVGTYRLLIQAARDGYLSLVRYGNKEWVYTLSHPFLLDIEFDIAIPKNENQKLLIKNLRTLTKESEINVYISPFYPIKLGEKAIYLDENKVFQKVEGESSQFMDMVAAENFKKIQDFFNSHYAWVGFDGVNEGTIDIHTQLRGRYTGKALWSEKQNSFGIGIDGQGWKEKAKSVSILAHEYFHAIVSNSSKLTYRNQSGGLNEHLADIHGVIFEAYERHGGKFDYTIGDEDVFTDSMKKQLIQKNNQWVTQEKIPLHLVSRYKVLEANLRNLYFPEASKHMQFSSYAEMIKKYPEDCEPSVDNDNCGVHFSSGVMNKALAMIISDIGLEKISKVLFNTSVYRLTPESNFKDYGYQLYEECYEQSQIQESSHSIFKQPTEADCEKIITNFLKVSVDIVVEN